MHPGGLGFGVFFCLGSIKKGSVYTEIRIQLKCTASLLSFSQHNQIVNGVRGDSFFFFMQHSKLDNRFLC